MYLNEIPDYLALGITTEYQRIKMEYVCLKLLKFALHFYIIKAYI